MSAKKAKLKCNSHGFKYRQPLLFIHTGACISLIAFVLVLVLLGTDAVAGEIDREYFFRRHHGIKVMSQNLYVGADLFRILIPGPPDSFPDLPEPLWIPGKVAEIFSTIQQTNFIERAETLADQIADSRPHLIGLQEVYRIRYQSPSDFPTPPNAEQVLYDYLAILLDALQARGLHYEPAAVVENAEIEFPMLVGFNGLLPLLDDVRITDHDVILARKNVKISNIIETNYSHNIEMPIGGIPVTFLRGYCGVDATIKDRTYRFVNTHLEVAGAITGSDAIQQLQANELVSSLAGEIRPIILVGDFNSGPDTSGAPAYNLINEAGFVDVWTRRRWRMDPGYTCCQDEDLDNNPSILFERIDLIFVRNNLGILPFSVVGPVRAFTVGDDPADKTVSGLWSSDHAGVFARLRIPYLDFRF
jgi:endonuclease/exonuclease/phosphatase family metal-dependent hydrolase